MRRASKIQVWTGVQQLKYMNTELFYILISISWLLFLIVIRFVMGVWFFCPECKFLKWPRRARLSVWWRIGKSGKTANNLLFRLVSEKYYCLSKQKNNVIYVRCLKMITNFFWPSFYFQTQNCLLMQFLFNLKLFFFLKLQLLHVD